MAIKKLNTSVNVISSLPDTPTAPDHTAQSLKRKFDEGCNTIKNYINDSLIPDICDEIAQTAMGDGAYRYIPIKKLLVSFTEPGLHTFTAEEYPSYNGVYDVITIAGGGGGYEDDVVTGGGGGDATCAENVKLQGVYSIQVGVGGAPARVGGTTSVIDENNKIISYALGGACSDENVKYARGAGKCGGNSTYGDGTVIYGAGGDCYGYGKGAIGSGEREKIILPKGYGGGGWGSVHGGDGAVLIYGYVREEI